MASSMDIKTLITKARALGAAKSCIGHWWNQRLTAIALIPLSLWFGFSLMWLPGADYGEVVGWMQRPWNTILLIFFVVASVYHAILGIQVVVEDYVQTERIRNGSILATKLLLISLALLMLVAVLIVAFTG